MVDSAFLCKAAVTGTQSSYRVPWLRALLAYERLDASLQSVL